MQNYGGFFMEEYKIYKIRPVGRPKLNANLVQLGVTIPDTMRSDIKKFAAILGISVSEMVRSMLAAQLSRLEEMEMEMESDD